MLLKKSKIVIASAFFFMAVVYFIMMLVKSYEFINSNTVFVVSLSLGAFLGSFTGLILILADKEQNKTAADQWAINKAYKYYSQYFRLSLILIAGVVISKLFFEVTQAKWYLKMQVVSHAVELCNEWNSSKDVKQEHKYYSKAVLERFSSHEVLVLACSAAMFEQNDVDKHRIKVAIAQIDNRKINSAFTTIGLLKEKKNQIMLINKLIQRNYLVEAEQLILDLHATIAEESESIITSISGNSENKLSPTEKQKLRVKAKENAQHTNKLHQVLANLALGYLNKGDYAKAEPMYNALLSANIDSVTYGLKRIYDAKDKKSKSVELLHKLLDKQLSKNSNPSQTYAYLGEYYDSGIGVTKNLEVARTYYEKGLKSLSSASKVRLAEMIYKGIGGDVNHSKAIELGYKTPKMLKVEKIKNGSGYIERGTYTCLYFNSIHRITQLQNSYGSLHYVKRAIPADCVDLTSYARGVNTLPIKKFVSVEGNYIQFKFSNNGDSAWVHLSSIQIK